MFPKPVSYLTVRQIRGTYRVSRQLVLTFDFNSWLFNLNFATLMFTKFPKLINFFTCWKKIANIFLFFLCRPTSTPWATHKNIFFFRFMYPVHWIMFYLQIHVPGYMTFLFSLVLCVAQAVEVARHKKNYFFWHFFSTCEKINQFWEFCKYQGGKI